MRRLWAVWDTAAQRLHITSPLYIVPALCLWALSEAISVHVAGTTESLSLFVVADGWQQPAVDGSWWIIAAALLLYWARLNRQPVQSADVLRERLRRFTPFLFALVLIRLAALWSPLTALFPILTLLWAPHAQWAVALSLAGYIHWNPEAPTSINAVDPVAQAPLRTVDKTTAGVLFLIGALGYGAYALYFCQVTMLHGDEGQYLRVTQSLLYDGDMDLSNNLDRAQTDEFHVTDFGIHKAPASPTGKVYSIHPIGLSVSLLPAYWLGLERWNNPRLGASLAITLLSSICLSLLFLWLRRIGVPYRSALSAVLAAACTGPFFFFSNQLYPEIPALVISLVTLCALTHWQRPGGHYQPLCGRFEGLALSGLTVLLACLPFLHARYAPLGLLCGSIVVAQAWYSPRRIPQLSTIGAIVALAIYALISFHYTFSGDWMGPFRPGNAWGEDVLALSTWAISLPGHWLHMGKGLLHTSPIFFFSVLGWWTLARARDRRLLLLGGLYLTTAAINGLTPFWEFGFCYSARFLMTALPALVWGLAAILPSVQRSSLALFLMAYAFAASVETVHYIAHFPEMGYDGQELLGRTLNDYYPFSMHFFQQTEGIAPVFDISFWSGLTLISGLWLLHIEGKTTILRWSLGLTAALLPTLWGLSETASSRLSQYALSPYIFSSDTAVRADPLNFGIAYDTEGSILAHENGQVATIPNSTEASFIAVSRLILPKFRTFPQAGFYAFTFPTLTIEGKPNENSGHLVVRRQKSVPVSSQRETRISYPLNLRQGPPKAIAILTHQTERITVDLEYSGYGTIRTGKMGVRFQPVRNMTRQSYQVFASTETLAKKNGRIAYAIDLTSMQQGPYHISMEISGGQFETILRRDSKPIIMALYALSSDAELDELLTQSWLNQDQAEWGTVFHPTYFRPHTEAIIPPWEITWPFGNSTLEQTFYLPHSQDLRLLLKYEGELPLQVESITIYRDTFESL